jgi:predicted DsbA family dithiol-disulfide isomerase
MAAVPVVVFSDFTCPFSHVTEAALRRLEDEGLAALRYAAFELYPAPAPLGTPSADDVALAQPLAHELGIALRTPASMPRTRKAHEAAKLAEQKGSGRAMRQALFAAYFGEGRDVGRIDVLVELAAALGLDATEAKVVLDVDTFSGAVDADRVLAERIGITAVPALVVGAGADAERVMGAQPYAALRELLERKAVGANPGAAASGPG